MSPLALTDTITLKHTGAKIPQLGFGVWDSPRGKCTESCTNALKVGYRHIDTAQGYRNEAEVGEAVKKSDVPRDQLFITTKILQDVSADDLYRQASEGVQKCDPREGGYVDLFLIHTPKHGPENRKMIWQVLERLVDEGKARNIGVSNFGADHLDQMKEYAKHWPPAVNQIELHPWCQQKEIVDYCDKNGIVLEAYCPIVRNSKGDDPTLAPIAKKLGVSPNQVLLRYCLQKGWVPLPKSDDLGRMSKNADLYGFEIPDEDMKALDKLDQGDDGAICPENIAHTMK